MKRVAILVPHSDTTLETDLQRELPAEFTIHTARMWLDEVGKEAERAMVDNALPEAVKTLREVTVYECAVFGCTSAAAVYKEEGMYRLHRYLEDELYCPSTSALGAVLAKIKELNAMKVAVITPYTDEVNAFFVSTMKEFGVNIVSFIGMGLSSDREIGLVTPEQIKEFVNLHRDKIDGDADLCFFSCTNLRAAEIIVDLELMLNKKVISSNQCIIDWILTDK